MITLEHHPESGHRHRASALPVNPWLFGIPGGCAVLLALILQFGSASLLAAGFGALVMVVGAAALVVVIGRLLHHPSRVRLTVSSRCCEISPLPGGLARWLRRGCSSRGGRGLS